MWKRAVLGTCVVIVVTGCIDVTGPTGIGIAGLRKGTMAAGDCQLTVSIDPMASEGRRDVQPESCEDHRLVR